MSFQIIHHERVIKIYSPEDEKWIGLKFDAPTWERLIKELNNPPDIGIEVSDGVKTKEEISGS